MERFEAFPGLPHDLEGVPLFPEDWQQQAAALTELMHARGAFTSEDWARVLTEECKGGAPYFSAWARAMARLLDIED